MDFSELLRLRRMVRSYLPEPVSPEALERVLEAARRAPSAGYAQGQHLVVVTEATMRRRIADLAGEPEYLARGFEPWLSRAPVHLVLCCREEDYHARYREPDKLDPEGGEVAWPVPYWHLDAGGMLVLILLAAVNEGLGAGFLGGHRLSGLDRLLGIPPGVQVLGLVTLGHPGPVQPAGSARRGRRPEAEVIHRGAWGSPAGGPAPTPSR